MVLLVGRYYDAEGGCDCQCGPTALIWAVFSRSFLHDNLIHSRSELRLACDRLMREQGHEGGN